MSSSAPIHDPAGRVCDPSGRPDGLGWIGDLGVLDRFRGCGIGTALLRHSFALLAARGIAEVRLNVDVETRPAQLANTKRSA